MHNPDINQGTKNHPLCKVEKCCVFILNVHRRNLSLFDVPSYIRPLNLIHSAMDDNMHRSLVLVSIYTAFVRMIKNGSRKGTNSCLSTLVREKAVSDGGKCKGQAAVPSLH